ncbi:hypothetical protein ACYX7E_16345 [Luteimonas sp. RIT-PG2_3]
MLRTVLAILAGLLVAIVLMLAIEWLGMTLFPLPPGTSLQTEEDLVRLMDTAPAAKLALVLLGWCIASVAGSWVAARIARQHRRVAALAVGALILCGVVLNVASLPHPMWMTVAGLALPLPLAWLGGRLAGAQSPRAAG